MSTMKKKKKKSSPVKLANIPPVKKMIDLSGAEKTDPKATKFVNSVEKLFIRGVKDLNIPVCEMYSTNPHLLASYMMGRQRYLRFMNDSGRLVDECLRDAISKTILDQLIYPELNKAVYPGKWDEFNMFALVRSRVNIIVPLDKPELGGYLCAMLVNPEGYTVADMQAEGNALSFMRMIDYNPNRLYQFGILVGQVVIQVMNTAVQSSIPYAYLCDPENRLVVRYGKELVELCSPVILKWSEEVLTAEGKSFSDKTAALVEDLYSPVMNYCAMLLSQSGMHPIYVRNIVDPKISDLKITQVIDKIENMGETNTTVQYRIIPKDLSIKRFGTDQLYHGGAQLNLNLGLLYRTALTSNPKKTDYSNIGNSIKSFLTELVAHSFNMYLAGALFIKEEKKPEEDNDNIPKMDTAPDPVDEPDADREMGETETPSETIGNALGSEEE